MLIERFLKERLKGTTKRGRTRSSVTVKKDLSLLHGIFAMAIQEKLAIHPPVSTS